jgi:hypothetical protein
MGGGRVKPSASAVFWSYQSPGARGSGHLIVDLLELWTY